MCEYYMIIPMHYYYYIIIYVYIHDFDLFYVYFLLNAWVLLGRIKRPRVQWRYIIQTNSSHSFQPQRLVVRSGSSDLYLRAATS